MHRCVGPCWCTDFALRAREIPVLHILLHFPQHQQQQPRLRQGAALRPTAAVDAWGSAPVCDRKDFPCTQGKVCAPARSHTSTRTAASTSIIRIPTSIITKIRVGTRRIQEVVPHSNFKYEYFRNLVIIEVEILIIKVEAAAHVDAWYLTGAQTLPCAQGKSVCQKIVALFLASTAATARSATPRRRRGCCC